MKTTDVLDPTQGLAKQSSQKSFYDGNPDAPVELTDELETKELWNFPISANNFQQKMGLNYALEIVTKTLHAEGFSVSERAPKNLSSDYFDTLDRKLNQVGISLRVRYNETSKKIDCAEADKYKRADLSFKIPKDPNDPFNTENRDEYEAETDIIIDDNGTPQFIMTFENLINKHVAQILKEKGDAQKAVDWAKYVYDTFDGFDWSQFQEHFSINCKRSQPYVTLYSIEDEKGSVVKQPEGHNKEGHVVIHKDKPTHIPQGHQVREIVYQFCLDTNRFFTEDPKGSRDFVKIATDYEVEFELQQRKDDYTPDAMASTKGVTYAEAFSARAFLKDLLNRIRLKNGIKEDKILSGRSKQYRGFVHVDAHFDGKDQQNVFAPQFGLRGRADMVVNRAYDWNEMVQACPALKEAIAAANDNRKPNLKALVA